MFVLLVNPSVFAQKRKPSRKSGAAVARVSRRPALAPVLTICVNDPLPKGYWIVRETFSDKCPIVNNFPRALVISVDGTEPGRAPDVANSVPSASITSSIEDARAKKVVGEDDELGDVPKSSRELWEEDRAKEAKIMGAVRAGKLLKGMSMDQVKLAWGEPITSFRSAYSSETLWVYDKGDYMADLTFQQGVLDSWHFTRKRKSK